MRNTRDSFTTDSSIKGAKRVRAEQDVAAVGGLRQPRNSVRARPSALVTGGRIKRLLDQAVKEAGSAFTTLGKHEVPEPLRLKASELRRLRAQEFGATTVPTGI